MQQSGFDIHNLSVVGNSAPAGVDQSGDYKARDWIKKWGFPSDATLFSISDIGPFAIGAPLVSAIAEGQEAGAVDAEFSALGAGLRRCGIPGIMCPTMKLPLNPIIISSLSTVRQMR